MTDTTEKKYIDHCNKLGATIERGPKGTGMFLWMPAPANNICSFGFSVEECLLMARTYLSRSRELNAVQLNAVSELVSVLD